MNNADRIVRMVYKEADLASLLTMPESLSERERSLILLARAKTGFHLRTTGDTLEGKANPYVGLLVQRYLRCYPANYQQDEVELIFEGVANDLSEYFHRNDANAALIFPRLAQEIFVAKNGGMRVRFENLLEWNGFASKVDANVFFAAFEAVTGRNAGCRTNSPRHTDERLLAILRNGYAETHMHLKGSGYAPEINWYYFLQNDAHPTSRGNRAFDEFIRFFWGGQSPQRRQGMSLAYQKVPLLRTLLLARLRSLEKKDDLTSNKLMEKIFFIQSDIGLRFFKDSDEFKGLSALFSPCTQPRYFDDPARYIAFEQDFLADMFEALLEGSLTLLDQYAFNVYLAALTQFKFCVSQDNEGMGFAKFKRAEDHKDCFCDGNSAATEALYRSVFDKYYREPGLRKVELRIAPKGKRALKRIIDQLDRANESEFAAHRNNRGNLGRIEYRLIIHFIKSNESCSTKRDEARKERLIGKAERDLRAIESFFELSDDLPGCGNETERNRMAALFRGRPIKSNRHYKNKLAGIDTANYEINCRPENYGPLFRRFAFGIAAQHDVGLTYHVGEDFTTLCSGVRAVDDVMEFMAFRRGDQLGHGLALGLDPKRYFHSKRGYIVTTLQDQVDDIAWMHHLILQERPRRADLLLFLHDWYEQYARMLFAGHFDRGVPRLDTYSLSYALRGNDPSLYLSGRCNFAGTGKNRLSAAAREADRLCEARELYRHYHFNEGLKRAGNKPLTIMSSDSYREAVALAQELVRQKVYRRGITIETNPSSNRKISSVQRYIDLPIIAFNRHGLTLPEGFASCGGNDLSITINTDDSALFQTDLANEYALVAAALLREGFDAEETYQYLDYLRNLSLMRSFVRG